MDNIAFESEFLSSHCVAWDLNHDDTTTALFFASASAFAPISQTQRSPAAPLRAESRIREEVDTIGNNIAVKSLLKDISDAGLLTKVAESGLLSKSQEAGLSLSKLEPLLAIVAKKPEILVLVEAATPEVLPLLPKIVSLAPPALPLLALAISVPPSAIGILGFGALVAAAGVVVVVPDDTFVTIALQTFAVGALGAAGLAGIGGSVVLGKILGGK